MADPNSGQNTNRAPDNVQREDSQGFRRRHLTMDGVIDYTLFSLGLPVVDVEIEPQQLGAFFSRTFDEYNRWMFAEKEEVLMGANSALNKYNLEELESPFGREVYDVQFITDENFFSPISGVFALGIPHPISHLSPDQYDLALRYIKTARTIYSSEPWWKWEEPVLWITAPSGFGGPFAVAYSYAQDCSRTEDVPARDHGWFKDYFMNLVKRAVGYARGKFRTIPGPGAQDLLGAEMIESSEAKLAELTEEIRKRSIGRTPPIGPGAKW